ncbi:MAG TPA: hypothetical protein VEU08_22680 [Vicinamibacterales bacterium]|nr:hypothetical protein [Vicinamibacterales bacterium]
MSDKPKYVPPLDEGWKEPRIRPKRCPACQRPNKPEAVKCSVCGYDLAALPPPVPTQFGKAKKGGGGAGLGTVFATLLLMLMVGAGGTVAYLGPARALALAQNYYKPDANPTDTVSASAAPAGRAGRTGRASKAAAQPSAREARKKTLETVKANEGACFVLFNDLMDRKKPSPDPNALHLAILTETRQLNDLPAVLANCGGDTNAMDADRSAMCTSAGQLQTCLKTVVEMQHERLSAAGYRVGENGLERIKP